MLALFTRQIDFLLGPDFSRSAAEKLLALLLHVERSRAGIDADFSNGKLKAAEFVKALDEHVFSFQKSAAEVLDPDHYPLLFDLEHGETVTLADPEIVEQGFPGQ